MTTADTKQELGREPYLPLRLHLSSGKTIDIPFQNTAWVQQNTVLIVHPIEPGTTEIGKYEVIALRLIERIEQIHSTKASKPKKKAG